MYNGMGVCFADFISFFLNIPCIEIILSHYHFHRIFKNRGQGGGFDQSGSASAIALILLACFVALHPKSTAMVMARRSVHLTTLFPGQA